MIRTNQESLFDWKEIKKYLDSLDPDLLEIVLSKEYTGLEDFYKVLHEEMTEQVKRVNSKTQYYREGMEKERSKRMELDLEKERLKKLL